MPRTNSRGADSADSLDAEAEPISRWSRAWRLLHAHAEICRPDTVFYAGLVALAGAGVAESTAANWRLVIAWIVPTFAWVASMYGGDFFDRELDAQAKPSRPIPSGRIASRTAFACAAGLVSTGFVLTAVVNYRALVVALIAAVSGIAYAKVLKARGLAGNVAHSVPTVAAFIFGAMAVHPTPTHPIAIVTIAVMLGIHDCGSNLLGALGDRDGDRASDCATYPAVHGDAATVRVLAAIFALWAVLALLVPFVLPTEFHAAYYGAGVAVALALVATSLLIVVRSARPISKRSCRRAHEVLVVERLVLPSALLVASGHYVIFAAVAVPSLVATVLATVLMRERRSW
ncbi:hypothetical protein FOS14_08365 [Skermania sp. ID1734]|uniref:UbiA family prenyltransferase n=1 Tax=Skermania sp. ID1734 TaxID=2597516 RepID=UPI00117E76C9|nr:UbiA family prenyltransferase [Skermania sp. ID1734]TSE00421.1 hypothetical protein FOS14_08365 [Skermania sp. ID1734]